MRYSLDENTPAVKDYVAWLHETPPFILEAIVHPFLTSAFFPISPFVVRALCRHIHQDARSILELGPGLGTLTDSILEKAHPDAQVIAIEKNARMVKYLKDRFQHSRLKLHLGDANQLDSLVDEQVDIVFSSIPFSMIPKAIAMQIIEKVQSLLKEGGLFICFQNRDVADGYIRRVFSDVTTEIQTKHFPEQVITIARKTTT